MLTSLTDSRLDTKPEPVGSAPSSDQDWFARARFGLFIHWGIYALLGHEDAEWVLFKSNLNGSEYNRLADQFQGERFDANALAALAKKAGMNYMVLTTRHHDGFCLFDTRTTPFNSVRTTAGRDFVGEFVTACRRVGLKVGLYYSIMSWQQPAIYTGPGSNPDGWESMVDETHRQIKELMTNYGKIDLLWYDGAVVPGIQDRGIQARYWRSKELNAMVRRLQPGILINNRSGLPEDFDTPEQHFTPPAPGRRCEACMTINQSWGYNIHDRDFKSAQTIVETLIRCCQYNSNLLLNIGPRADGSIQDECVNRLEQVGLWLRRNGESIYGTERCTYTEANHIAGPVTRKADTLYVHLDRQAIPTVVLDGIGHVKEATVLGSDHSLVVTPGKGDAVEIPGIDASMFYLDHAVLALKPETDLSHPANLLGGGNVPRIEAGNAPVLGDDPDRRSPPIEPVQTGMMLADQLCSSTAHTIEPSQTWCPGWHDWQVITPTSGNSLDILFSAAFKGNYDLNLGMITREPGRFRILLDGQSLDDDCLIRNPGFPDTWDFRGLTLDEGDHRLSLQTDGPFGLYALRLAPVWRPLPSESWYTIGPFPTGFGPQKPVREVRKALEKVWPPETTFDPNASYSGVDDRPVSWKHSDIREGEHSDCGINFPYRCGTHATGVCYARTTIVSPEDRDATILVGCDWWLNVYVNGSLVRTRRDSRLSDEDGAQFSTWKPMPAKISLRKGENTILVKGHPGTCANWFTFRISDPGDLEVVEK